MGGAGGAVMSAMQWRRRMARDGFFEVDSGSAMQYEIRACTRPELRARARSTLYLMLQTEVLTVLLLDFPPDD